MKKVCLALITCATLGSSYQAMAETNHSISLGYALSEKYNNGLSKNRLDGATVKYRYEWDSPISVISSFTYLGNNVERREGYEQIFNKIHKLDVQVFNFMIGPAYRFNEFVSLYGLIGAYNSQAKEESYISIGNSSQKRRYKSYCHRHTDLSFGAGVQINPLDNVVIDIGYEALRSKNIHDDSSLLHTANVGIGYRF